MTGRKDDSARVNSLLSEINDLKRAIDVLSALNELATQIGAAKDLEEINKILIRKALEMTHAEQGVVTLIDREESDLETIHRTRFNQEDTAVMRPDPLVLGWMEKARKPLRIQIPDELDTLKIKWHPAVKSFLCVPLIVKGKLVGLISLFNKSTGSGFSPDDEKSLFIIAMQSAQVLENQRLRDQYLEITRNELDLTRQSLSDAQHKLVHSEKMAALGQLTAGVAHEIKNPLNFINNFAQLSSELVGDIIGVTNRYKATIGEEDAEELSSMLEDLKLNTEKINEYGQRVDDIIQSMVQHSGTVSGKKTSVNLNKLVEDALFLVYKNYVADDPTFSVQFVKDYDINIRNIEAYPQEIGRVFVNLLDNALYSVNEKRLSINSGHAPQISVRTKKAGDHVEVYIADNGNGIPKEIQGKIFEPFFTTKPTGSSTGLGLSLSHDIVVKGHGGALMVESSADGGAVFIVRLPA